MKVILDGQLLKPHTHLLEGTPTDTRADSTERGRALRRASSKAVAHPPSTCTAPLWLSLLIHNNASPCLQELHIPLTSGLVQNHS